jgi:hypothetical protein
MPPFVFMYACVLKILACMPTFFDGLPLHTMYERKVAGSFVNCFPVVNLYLKPLKAVSWPHIKNTFTYAYKRIVDLLKAVKAVTRKSRYYGTKARSGIMKSDCGKPRETTQGTENTHEKHRKHGNSTQEENNTTKKQHTTHTQNKLLRRDMIQGQIRHVQRPN